MYNSGYYDTTAVKPVDNEVLEIKMEAQLDTRLNMQQFAHADYSLAEAPGMVKKIRTYHGTGILEELAMGEGNTEAFGAYWDEVEYRVGTTQGYGMYYDEQLFADPQVIDKMVNHMSEEMVNDMTRKIVGEFKKTNNIDYVNAFNFDVISDAIAEFPDEQTENENLFILINRGDSSAWRKALKDELKYVEAFVRKGYIGTVCGVPMYWSDAIPAGQAFVGTSEAVTIFVKKGINTEAKREPNTRQNEVWIRKVMLVALTNDAKLIKLVKMTDPRTGKTLVAAKPDDWASKYNTDYYFFDKVNNTCELNTEDDWDLVKGFIYE